MIPEYERSKIATLSATFSQNIVPVDPTNLQVTVYYQGTVKVAASSPTKVTTGQYYKEISIGSDWDLDYYSAVWTGTIAGVDFRRSEQFKVIDSVTETDISVPSSAYCTVNDVLQELSGIDYSVISDYVNILNTRILQTEYRVNNRVGKTFKRTTTAEYLDGTGQTVLTLPNTPVYELSSLAIRASIDTDWWTPTNIAYINCVDHRGISVRTQSTDAVVKESDLLVDCVNGTLTIPPTTTYKESNFYPFWDYTFINGNANIKVAYTYGYDADGIPLDIRMLCAKMVARDFLQLYGDLLSGGSSSISLDGVGRGFGLVPFAGRIQLLDKDINDIISNYRVIGVN